MGLELLTQADLVLNKCGRAVPPPGFKFVDLPRIIPFHHTPQGAVVPTVPFFYGLPDSPVTEFQNIVTVPVTLNVTEGTPFSITVVGDVISIIAPAAGFTVNQFIAAWAASPASSLLSIVLTPSILVWFSQTVVAQVILPATFAFSEGWPTQDRVENTSNTLFICMGIMLQTDPVQVRIKWPNGRYWNQFPSGNPFLAGSADFPQGTGGNLYALDEPVYIERGGKVAVEMSGTLAAAGANVDVHLWGKLRYLLKDRGGLGEVDGQTCIVGYPDSAKAQKAPSCLVGYPVKAAATLSGATITMIKDPVEVLKYRPRFSCWPNGNIMAPEFRLGNQCETYTPPGYDDEAYTFFSDPYVLSAANSFQSYSNAVGVPGQDDVVIRRFRAITTWTDGATGVPVVGMRLPNGYSVTGGDQIPINLGYWVPVFPTLRIAAGTRLILDVADSLTADTGSITVQFEFDAVKRRKRLQ
jgi:hypothetical protein